MVLMAGVGGSEHDPEDIPLDQALGEPLQESGMDCTNAVGLAPISVEAHLKSPSQPAGEGAGRARIRASGGCEVEADDVNSVAESVFAQELRNGADAPAIVCSLMANVPGCAPVDFDGNFLYRFFESAQAVAKPDEYAHGLVIANHVAAVAHHGDVRAGHRSEWCDIAGNGIQGVGFVLWGG